MNCVQNVKDSFYIALRNRLATLDPGRLVNIRGVERPAILVEEAENPTAEPYNNVYVVRWTQTTITPAPSVVRLGCEIHYATTGARDYEGLDRGRRLADLDQELSEMLTPMSAPKLDFTTTPATMLMSNVFWAEPVFSGVEILRDQLRRVVAVEVFAYKDSQ